MERSVGLNRMQLVMLLLMVLSMISCCLICAFCMSLTLRICQEKLFNINCLQEYISVRSFSATRHYLIQWFNGTFKISCYMLVVYSSGLRKGTTVCPLYELLYYYVSSIVQSEIKLLLLL